MPTAAVTHIQNRAPGPPTEMAVATPMMLPVPMVAARAIIRALKWLMSPISFSLERAKVSRRAWPSMVTWMPRRRTVSRMPVPTSSTSRGTPQT